MTELDEAIRHAEEVAELNEAECFECAEEHRQLAEWLKELKAFREERPQGEWKVYSYCSDGFEYKCSLCGRVVNEGYWFKQKEILSVYPYCHCGAKMIAVEDPIKWYSGIGKRGLRAEAGFVDDAADAKSDLEYLKVGNTIYTQDDDKQGWTGREGK